MDLGEEADAPEDEPKGLTALFARLDAWARERFGKGVVAIYFALFVAGWAYLDALLVASPDTSVLAWLRPAPEVTVLLAVACAAVWLGVSPKPRYALLATTALVPLRLASLADRIAEQTLGRPFHMPYDLPLVWELLIVLDDAVDRLTLILYLSGSALAVGVLLFLAKQAFAFAGNFFVVPLHRWLFVGTVGLLLLLEVVSHPFADASVDRIAEEVGRWMDAGEREAELLGEWGTMVDDRPPEGAFAGLDRRDAYFLVVEGYGAGTWDVPAWKRRLAPTRQATTDALEEAGYHVRSHRLEAPVPSGLCWLARANLVAGVPVEHPSDYELLGERDVPTLPSLAADAGFSTVRMLPGVTREREDRDLLGWARTIRSWELGYQGPPFGRSAVPDQLALARLFEREVSETSGSVLSLVALSSASPPWTETPRYVEDWSTLENGVLYRDQEPVGHDVGWLSLEEGEGAYLDAIAYDLEVLRGFLTEVAPARPRVRRNEQGRRRRGRWPLFVVVGDHPPPPALARTGEVPVHVLSRDDDLVARFESEGFVEGWQPPPAAAAVPMHGFLDTLLRATAEAPED